LKWQACSNVVENLGLNKKDSGMHRRVQEIFKQKRCDGATDVSEQDERTGTRVDQEYGASQRHEGPEIELFNGL